MRWLDRLRGERRDSPENIKSSATAEEFWQFFGLTSGGMPAVTIDSAMRVPAVLCGIDFLASAMAAVPRHAFRVTKDEAGVETTSKIGGALQRIVNEAPNPEWSAFDFWKYIWTQHLTGGRGLAWIERAGTTIVAIWPMDPTKVTVKRVNFRKVYEYRSGTRSATYDASEVIDLPFMLKADQLGSYSAIVLAERAIQLALALNDYASSFFHGGGVLPLALEGPLPKGGEAMNRAVRDIDRAIKQARDTGKPFFGMPPGHKLTPIGAEPDKGQMTEARRFQVEEIARVLRLPPVFLQDLTHGTFSNTEQQDLNLVKHRLSQMARQCEDELNLKLFGATKNQRFVEHNMDGVMRGDFKSRIEALSKAVTSSLLTPDEARELDNRPNKPGGDKLYIQGANVPLEMAGTRQATDAAAAAAPATGKGEGEDEDGTQGAN